MKLGDFSPKNVFEGRIQTVQKQFPFWKVDGCVIDDLIDLFYLTGMQLSLGFLIITPKNACLFVDGRYFQMATKQVSIPVAHLKDEEKVHFLTKQKVKKLLFDSRTSYQRYLHLVSLKEQTEKKGVALSLIPQAAPLKNIRSVKNEEELRCLRKSAKLLWKGFLHLKKKLNLGMTEREASRLFEIYCLEQGAEKLAFEPIIAFGENSSMPHYRAGNRKLKKGDLILIDIGVVVDKYHSDMTQVLFKGKADPFFHKLFDVVKRSQQAALSLCRPGTKIGELDQAARRVMSKEKMENYFLHSLGHGIGLETHEFPRLKFKGEDHDCVLKKGMVFTVEPGLYIPEKGGIRLETTVAITEKGHENFFPPLRGITL